MDAPGSPKLTTRRSRLWMPPTTTVFMAGCILALAFAVRLGVVLATPGVLLRNDAADYRRLGLLLAHGQGFGASHFAPGGGPTAARPPLYPLVLAGTDRLAGDSLIASRVLQVLLGTAAVALAAIVAQQLRGQRAA